MPPTTKDCGSLSRQNMMQKRKFISAIANTMLTSSSFSAIANTMRNGEVMQRRV